MRSLLSLLLAFIVATSALLLSGGGVADASFHCMRIHAVMGGFNGDNNIQYVELRMSAAGQTLVGGHTIQFFNADGAPRTTFTFPLGAVVNGDPGDSILIATSEFSDPLYPGHATGGVPDYTFTLANTTGGTDATRKHPVSVPGGTVVFAGALGDFNCSLGLPPADSVSYGGATGLFPPAAPALPNPGTLQALRLSNLNTVPTNNATEYALQNVAVSMDTVVNHPPTLCFAPPSMPTCATATDVRTPRNNGRAVLVLNLPAPPPVGGVAEAPDLAMVPDAAQQSSGDARSWLGYAIAGGAAAAAMACGAGWYVYRRRTV